MIIKQISILKEFACTGADCPVNCCKGWKIPVDDAARRKYQSEKGMLAFRLRHSIKREKDITAFRSVFGRCPFWGRDHLCSIQKKHGTEYMPHICVHFPRQYYNLGFFCEETLYLACPEAVRLFLIHAKKGDHFAFEEMEGDVSYEVNTTNDDKDFLEYLLKAREQLIEMLDGGCRFDSRAMLQYGRDAQNACLEGRELPNPCEYREVCKELFVMDCTILNHLFFNGFYQSYLKTRSPLLYKLCRKYMWKLEFLSRINGGAANRRLRSLKTDLYRKIPELDLVLNRYYEYYLQTKFLNIFEDYSFSRHLFLGMANAQMLWILLALFAENKKTVTEGQIAEVIAVYERRASWIEDGLKFITFP